MNDFIIFYHFIDREVVGPESESGYGMGVGVGVGNWSKLNISVSGQWASEGTPRNGRNSRNGGRKRPDNNVSRSGIVNQQIQLYDMPPLAAPLPSNGAPPERRLLMAIVPQGLQMAVNWGNSNRKLKKTMPRRKRNRHRILIPAIISLPANFHFQYLS